MLLLLKFISISNCMNTIGPYPEMPASVPEIMKGPVYPEQEAPLSHVV